MVVKCRICSKTLNSNTCCMIDGKPYCSREEYEEYNLKIAAKEQLKKDIENEILYILGEDHFVTQTDVNREWKAWNAKIDNNNLFNLLKQGESEFQMLIWRLGDTLQYNKIRYLSSLVQNRISNFLEEQAQIAKNKEAMAALNNRFVEHTECTKWHRYVSKKEKLRQAKEECRKKTEELAKEIEIE